MKAIFKKPPSSFAAALDEALALFRELHEAGSAYGDARDEKLSAQAFLAEALEFAGMTEREAEALDKKVWQAAASKHLQHFVTQVGKQAVATQADQGATLRPPTGNLHTFMGHGREERTQGFINLLVEASMLGTNPPQLVAVAALRATREAPDAFGKIEDWDKHHAALAAKGERLDALYRQMAENWNQADIQLHDIDKDGRARVSIRANDATVPVVPLESLGERLCAQLASLGG